MQKGEIFRKILIFCILLYPLLFNSDGQLLAEETTINHYDLAVKKYINNDLDGALLELDNYSKINPDDRKINSLRSLILNRKPPLENNQIAEDYFRRAFKEYLEGNLIDASYYLQEALKLFPDFKKADRFLKVIKKRQEGIYNEDSEFIEGLLKEMQKTTLLPEEKTEERISADFKDEEVSNILRVLSQLYKINIVTGENIDAKITVSLADITLEEALNSILETVGYSYIKEGNVIRVIDKNNFITSKTFKLDNISLIKDRVSSATTTSTAKDLIEKIKDVLSENGKLIYDEPSRTLMVTDTLAKIETISDLISQLDVFSPQVLIEAKIVELSPSYNEYVGIDWSVLEGYTVTLKSPTATYEHGEDRSSKPQVKWTDTAAETGDTYEHEYKLEQAVTWTLKRTLSATLSAENFQLVFSNLKSNTDAKVISSPNILTKGGEEAYLTISEQYPIPSYTYNEEQGSFEVTGFEYKDVGINLAVIPYPVKDDYVSLLVVPEVSKSAGSTTFGGAGGATIPIISTTKAQTQTFIKSGHTLAVGGLIKEETKVTEKKLPFFGDIPFLGKIPILKYAFTYKSTSIEKKNILIFITPTIITKENMDMVTALQSKKMGPEYEIELPEAEGKRPKPKWGRRYKRKTIDKK